MYGHGGGRATVGNKINAASSKLSDDKLKAQEAKVEFGRIQERVKQSADQSRSHILQSLNPDVLRPSSWSTINLMKPHTLYKVVAAVDGHLVSVYDGETKYALGKWTRAKHGAASWPPLYACFYGFLTAQQAISAQFPVNSRLQHAPKVLMLFEALGASYYEASSNTWALSQVKPVKLITQVSSSAVLDVHYAVNPVSARASPIKPMPQSPQPFLV